MEIEQFGEALLKTQDLDPIYNALHKLELPILQLRMWLTAYWSFYNAGVACHVSESADMRQFWNRMSIVAHNTEPTPFGTRWPRGQERRHCRGAAAVKMTEALEDRYREDIQEFVRYVSCMDLPAPTCADVMKRVKEHYLFGDWIAFKVADMSERVLHRQVSFQQSHVFMFDQPRKAALQLWSDRAQGKNWQPGILLTPKDPELAIRAVVEHLIEHFKAAGCMAPPNQDRPLGLQEVETVLCKWKSHMNGHYPILNDVHEIREGLIPWRDFSPTAQLFIDAMPKDQQ